VNAFNKFHQNHPIILNILLMIPALIAVGYIFLLFIDVFTNHGAQVKVPDVRNLTLEQAIEKIEAVGLKWEISDSATYDEYKKPGIVLDQDPKANSMIKPLRIVYIKVNAMHERRIPLPKLVELSGRQGLATLRGMGFRNITVDSVASHDEGLILSVTINGKHVAAGTSVPVSAPIRLTVGDGSIMDSDPDEVLDDAERDSIDEVMYQESLERYEREMAEYEQEQELRQAEEQRAAEREQRKEKSTTDEKKEKSSADKKSTPDKKDKTSGDKKEKSSTDKKEKSSSDKKDKKE